MTTRKPRKPQSAKLCHWTMGSWRNTISKVVLFRKRELAEFLGHTRWAPQKSTRWVCLDTHMLGLKDLTGLSPWNSVRATELTEFGIWTVLSETIFGRQEKQTFKPPTLLYSVLSSLKEWGWVGRVDYMPSPQGGEWGKPLRGFKSLHTQIAKSQSQRFRIANANCNHTTWFDQQTCTTIVAKMPWAWSPKTLKIRIRRLRLPHLR